MTYIIYKDGIEENRIVADEEFCQQYYNSDGYSYAEEQPEPETESIEVEPTEQEDMMAMLVDHEYRITLMELDIL